MSDPAGSLKAYNECVKELSKCASKLTQAKEFLKEMQFNKSEDWAGCCFFCEEELTHTPECKLKAFLEEK